MSIRGTGLIRLRVEITGNLCKCGIEPPGFISHGVNINHRLGKFFTKFKELSFVSYLFSGSLFVFSSSLGKE